MGFAAMCAPAQAQDALKFSDLEGWEVRANIIHEQVIRREGRDRTVKNERDLKVVFGPAESIGLTVIPTIHRQSEKRETRAGKTSHASFTLGEVRDVSAAGGGTAVWSFADGTLTSTRTFKEGAARLTVTFTRSGQGFSCTLTERFARENGTGPLRMTSAVDGAPIVMVSSKQTSSRCTVKKS
jgi:hypothetical protein